MKTNTPNPLVPQGTFADARGKSQVRIAVFTILAVHMVLLTALLMAGCRKSSDVASNDPTNVFTPDFSQTSTGAFTQPPVDPPAVVVTPPPTVPESTSPPVAVPPMVVPPEHTSLAPVPGAGGLEQEHTILPRESFYTLAKKYGVTIAAIKAANPGVDSTKLQIGQKVKIPAPTAHTAAPTPTAPAPEGAEKIHMVKSGENLTTIARDAGISVKALRAANNLKTTQIKVGQKLKIPVKATAAAPALPDPLSAPVPAPIATSAPVSPAPIAP